MQQRLHAAQATNLNETDNAIYIYRIPNSDNKMLLNLTHVIKRFLKLY
jgi:hypothetical protein